MSETYDREPNPEDYSETTEELEEYRIQDLVDDAIAMGKTHQDMVNDFVYSASSKAVARYTDSPRRLISRLALERNISTLDFEEQVYEPGRQDHGCAIHGHGRYPRTWCARGTVANTIRHCL